MGQNLDRNKRRRIVEHAVRVDAEPLTEESAKEIVRVAAGCDKHTPVWRMTQIARKRLVRLPASQRLLVRQSLVRLGH
jgi:hypothetical protein